MKLLKDILMFVFDLENLFFANILKDIIEFLHVFQNVFGMCFAIER